MSTKKNVAYNVAYRIFSVLLPVITAPYLSRVVGKAGVGMYSEAWTVSELFCLVGMLGLADYGVRTVAQVRDDREKLDRTFSGIWQMQLIVSVVMLLAWAGYAAIAGEGQPIALALIPASIACLVNLEWCLMGLDLFRPLALRSTFVKLAAAAAIFAFVRQKSDLWIYGLAWGGSSLISNISCLFCLRGRIRYTRVPLRESLTHLKPCAVLFVSVIAINVYRSMDKVMVSLISGVAENGLYDNAEKIIYCLSGFISAIGTVMMPKISNLIRRGETERVRVHLDTTMNLMLCMVTAMAFGVASLAKEFAPLFYGSDFAYSGRLMIPLAFTLIMIGFGNVIRTQWIIPCGKDRIFVRSVCIGALVNLAVNALLIPRMGSMGAVIGTLLAELLSPLLQSVAVRGDLPFGRYLKYLAVYCGIGGIMLLCVRLLVNALPFGGWLSVGVCTAAGAGVYGILTLVYWKATGKNYLRLLLKRG